MPDLSPDELLSTTRSVRKRLDLTRPVERRLIEECLALAQQAPNGGNRQGARFVVVTDAATRRAIGDLYRQGWERYLTQGIASAPQRPSDDPAARRRQRRIGSSAKYLAEHLHDVPVHVIPCHPGRTEGAPQIVQGSAWGSVLPAVWSFMLAARARGLGSAWTTIHLFHEREVADVLGIPFDEWSQMALIPVAHAVGTGFRPGPRLPLDELVRWERW